MVGALLTALLLRVTEPVLANDGASCSNTPASGPLGAPGTWQPGPERALGRATAAAASSTGQTADCEEHAQPWQAELLLQPNQLYCGAVLVAPQWLLTAAHCHKKIFRIPLGHVSLSPVYELGQPLFGGVKSIPNPGFSHPGHTSDLMLMKLNGKIMKMQNFRPINISPHYPAVGTSCLVSGGGTTSSPQVNFPQTLQCLEITMLNHERCKEAYPNQIHNTMFCAGDEAGRDSCQGDWGAWSATAPCRAWCPGETSPVRSPTSPGSTPTSACSPSGSGTPYAPTREASQAPCTPSRGCRDLTLLPDPPLLPRGC